MINTNLLFDKGREEMLRLLAQNGAEPGGNENIIYFHIKSYLSQCNIIIICKSPKFVFDLTMFLLTENSIFLLK